MEQPEQAGRMRLRGEASGSDSSGKKAQGTAGSAIQYRSDTSYAKNMEKSWKPKTRKN